MSRPIKPHIKRDFPALVELIEAVSQLARLHKYVCSSEPILLNSSGVPFTVFDAPLFFRPNMLQSEDVYFLESELNSVELDDKEEISYRILRRLEVLAGPVLVAIHQLISIESGLAANTADYVTQKRKGKFH